ncbi:hypothetical protein SAMN04488498_1103 [Mesorhizobium albiziae]|uniref:Uncharacterized protein n=2 Tax=Neomesorhizobium albiziae TaxID=335020 RepID=A0A1I4B9S0_9HYPH|nr:hypothetical protein SAMN04488498_1103 [Mesorhizobium albiziae]
MTVNALQVAWCKIAVRQGLVAALENGVGLERLQRAGIAKIEQILENWGCGIAVRVGLGRVHREGQAFLLCLAAIALRRCSGEAPLWSKAANIAREAAD